MQPVDPPNDATVTPRAPRRGFLSRLAIAALAGAIVVVAAIGQYVASNNDDTAAAAEDVGSLRPTTTVAPTTASTTTIPPTTTTTIPAIVQPANSALPPPPNGAVRKGDQAAEIMGYEARLLELKFDPGPVDGVFDEKTRFAAEAFDKLMNWPRDGVIDQPFVDALNVFQYPPAHMPLGEADRVEINLDTQVLIVFRNWQPVLISPISSGNGKRFCGGADGCQYAITYTGKFHFTWHVNGWRNGDLGRLYKPWYFNGGIAIHGYTSVPNKPASHGCARIPMYVAEYFGQHVYDDMVVYVYGTQAPQGGYPADSPNGGSPTSSGNNSGGSTAPPATPAPTTPPTVAPATPDTPPPTPAPEPTVPPETTPPTPPPTTPSTTPPPPPPTVPLP